ncbi:energy-coupling factor ABC transporter ATP-binding protein [Desulfuribacillus alkaliarsenatis]|uniref:ABC transporter ATP-binding protein n=2 Tax=Desulfuribacillus alkaliarsenatis TaxID=766136 RepID=A0A1E5G4K9_9FIRM|nr:energy-coupling factor ABC transporter ATP-binding protein [Desulfuribacillus alkaliarsenatis]
MQYAAEIKGISYCYPDSTKALHQVSLSIPEGAKVAILGANGCGKSTLLYHLNGLLLAQTGNVKIFGSEVNEENIQQIREKVGFVFANPDSQLFATSVREDIAFGPRNQRLNEEEVQMRANKAMEQVGIKNLAERPPQNLSLGQKKRVAIAGVLAMHPDILVFDEITVGLDPASKRELFEILANLEQQGKTLIISTHDVDLAFQWASEIVVMADGKICATGSGDLLRDKELVARTALETPQVAEIFSETSYRPKSVTEAKQIVNRLDEKASIL